MMKYLRGWEAIERKRKNDKIILNKHTDPTEEAVHNITLEQAIDIAKEDQNLIYAPMIWVSNRRKDWEGAQPGTADIDAALERQAQYNRKWHAIGQQSGTKATAHAQLDKLRIERDEAREHAEALAEALRDIEANLTGRDNFAERVESSLRYAREALANWEGARQ